MPDVLSWVPLPAALPVVPGSAELSPLDTTSAISTDTTTMRRCFDATSAELRFGMFTGGVTMEFVVGDDGVVGVGVVIVGV